MGLHLRKEWNHNGNLGKNESYDVNFNIEPVWHFPFRIGGARLAFDGFADYNTPKGKDAAGRETRAEFITRPLLKLDISPVVGQKAHVLELGVGFQYDVPHGTVSQVWYPSPTLGMKRRVYVYTPPGYETGAARYPVLYLLHGGGGDEAAWTELGCAPQILDNLIAQGRSKPMIVVMTNGNATQSASQDFVPLPAPPGRPGEGMLRFPESLVKDVIPFVDATYRTQPDREGRAVAGLSMGGAQALYAGLNNLDRFAWIGALSGGFPLLPGVAIEIPAPANAATLRGPDITRSIDPAKYLALHPALDAGVNSKLRLSRVEVLAPQPARSPAQAASAGSLDCLFGVRVDTRGPSLRRANALAVKRTW